MDRSGAIFLVLINPVQGDFEVVYQAVDIAISWWATKIDRTYAECHSDLVRKRNKAVQKLSHLILAMFAKQSLFSECI